MQGHKSDEFILESKLDFSARTIKHYDCVLLHFNCEREKTGGSLPKTEYNGKICGQSNRVHHFRQGRYRQGTVVIEEMFTIMH